MIAAGLRRTIQVFVNLSSSFPAFELSRRRWFKSGSQLTIAAVTISFATAPVAFLALPVKHLSCDRR
jgi:hypothetical protein